MDRIPALHRRIKHLAKAKPQDGTLLSFTTIHHPPVGFGSEPYAVGLIELESGEKVTAQLVANDFPLRIGATVAPRMRHIRTMSNGLRINDFKYEVVAVKPVEHAMPCYVLAFTGPSGVGKTTITRALLSLFAAYSEQVPVYTTRKPKKSDSEPYVHLSEEEFDKLLARREIIATTSMPSKSEVRRYGYRKKDIEAIWQKEKLPIVTTDIHLLTGLAEHLGREAILSCGLLPPGTSRRRMLSALLHRLRGRGRETESQIKERLKVAESDLQAFDTHSHLFDHVLVNDKLEVCVETIRELVKPV